jgi:hypothetical protein
MVEKSISPLQINFGLDVVCEQSSEAPLPERRLPPSVSAILVSDFLATELANRIWLVWRSSGKLWQGAGEYFACRPSAMDSAGCHGQSTLLVALGHQFAPSFSWLHEHHAQ